MICNYEGENYTIHFFFRFFLSYLSRVVWNIIAPFSPLKTTTLEYSIIFALFPRLHYSSDTCWYSIRLCFSKNLLFLSLIGIFISSLISGSFISLLIRYIVSFLMGFSAGWIYPLTVKLIGNIFNGKELPIAMSIYSLAWSLSIIASGIIIPFLTINLGWEFPFYFIDIIPLF